VGPGVSDAIKPGVNLKQAESELSVIYKDREQEERRRRRTSAMSILQRPVFSAARGARLFLRAETAWSSRCWC